MAESFLCELSTMLYSSGVIILYYSYYMMLKFEYKLQMTIAALKATKLEVPNAILFEYISVQQP